VKGPIGGVQKSTTKKIRQVEPAEGPSAQLLAQVAQAASGVAQTEPTIRLMPEVSQTSILCASRHRTNSTRSVPKTCSMLRSKRVKIRTAVRRRRV